MNTRFLKAVFFLIVPFIALHTWTADAQTVKGVVKDAATSEPLPGVVLIFEGIADGAGHREGTQTWADGSYILEIPEGIEGVLTLHMIGYSDVMSGAFKLKKGEELVMDFEMQTPTTSSYLWIYSPARYCRT